jgi:hypothetical protein
MFWSNSSRFSETGHLPERIKKDRIDHDEEVSRPRKKREAAKSSDVRVGNLSDISGNVNIAGRNVKTYSTQTTTGLSAGEIRQLFDQLYAQIEARPEK